MMLGALPQTVEARTLAAREVTLAGVVDPSKLLRFGAAIVAAKQPVVVNADFYRDEEKRYIVSVQVTAEVQGTCQRCLGTLDQTLASSALLAVVWTDEQAAQLPPRYEPLVAEAEIDFWEVVEDELLLALPSFSYHSDTNCGAETGVQALGSEETAVSVSPERDNPFDVLKALKGDVDK
jgi:uncharacterized protein